MTELAPTDMTTLCAAVFKNCSKNVSDLDGLSVLTAITDLNHALNGSMIKKDFPRTLRVETIASSAGGTAAVTTQP